MRILYIGSFSFGVNDIVSLMLRCLRRSPNLDVHHCDPGGCSRRWQFYRKHFRRGVDEVKWLDSRWLRRIVKKARPEVLMCVAGGYSPSREDHRWLQEMNVKTVCIALSDPDVMPVQTAHFGKFFNLLFTNAKKSLAGYHELGIEAKLLPFAADVGFHRPLPDVETLADVVIVGGSRPERERMVARLGDAGISVICYGGRWPDQVINGKTVPARMVCGQDQVRAINSGRLYFSFARTFAGHTNVKVGLFEATACGATVLVDDFPELHDYFEVGKEVIGFRSDDHAVEKARWLLENPTQMSLVAKAGRARVLRDHKWEDRWDYVFKEVSQCCENEANSADSRVLQ